MTDKICPECGTEQDESFTYCKNCGALLSGKNDNNSFDNSDDVKICPECGAQEEMSSKFCKNCGALLSKENENHDLQSGFNQQDSSQNAEKEEVSPDDFNDMKICPECGAQEDVSSKFCKNCGFEFPKENKKNEEWGSKTRCGNCGAKLNEEMYCPDCGEPTGIMICPNCRQKTVNEDFCSHCGYKINKSVKNCHNCGSKMDVNANVCHNCGAPVIYKNPLAALALSFLFPGLGQLYNNQNRKAITLIVGYIVSLILCLILVGVILAIVVWIYGMYDAYNSAKALNDGESLEDKIF